MHVGEVALGKADVLPLGRAHGGSRQADGLQDAGLQLNCSERCGLRQAQTAHEDFVEIGIGWIEQAG